MNDALSPHLEKIFLDGSWGFRRGRDPYRMIADLEADMAQHNRTVLATADIRRAFDNVRIADVLDAHQDLFSTELAHVYQPGEDEQVLSLIRTALRGANTDRQIGIDQGNPYAAAAFNVLLHCVHDVPLTTDVCFPSWFRYADNLVYAAHDVSEGQRILCRIRRLLRNHYLELKQDAQIADLAAGDSALLLGLELRRGGKGLIPTIGHAAWEGLKEDLRNAHTQSNPTQAAKGVLLGWLDAWAMALEKVEPAIGRVLHLAARGGFRKSCSRDELRRRVERAQLRWRTLRRSAFRRHRLRAPPLAFSGFD